MDTFTIYRVHSGDTGTFGVMAKNFDAPFAVTAELPWNKNRVSKSCIPSGEYICSLTDSPRFGKTYIVNAVSGRSHILFHKGNRPIKDSRGCILVGEKFDELAGADAVLESTAGYNEFMAKANNAQQFKLIIHNVSSF